MIKEAIVKIVNKEDLTYHEAYTVMNEIMSGETTPTQNAAFLSALSTKSARAETTDEIAGCAAAMRAHATQVDTGMEVFEIVGTGGDNAHSFNISTTYQQLKLLREQGETNTRIALEDFIASLAAEYYNFIQQKIRMKNLLYAVQLSKERLRIVEARYHVGDFSRLDYQQAKVDFNADSAQYMKQQELLHTSRINLNELMGNEDVDQLIQTPDSIIDVNQSLDFEELWKATLSVNSSLLKADQNTQLAQMDYKKVNSRNYPYVRLNAGYGYTFNKYDINSYSRRNNFGFNGGITVGFNLFDGNRKRERRNASIAVKNARLQRDELELALRADLSNLWQAYRNNLEMLNLERQNLIAAKDNHDIAIERYMQGDLSGIEMREAQQSLLDAEERILTAEYNTKLCEISLLQISGKVTKYLE